MTPLALLYSAPRRQSSQTSAKEQERSGFRNTRHPRIQRNIVQKQTEVIPPRLTEHDTGSSSRAGRRKGQTKHTESHTARQRLTAGEFKDGVRVEVDAVSDRVGIPALRTSETEGEIIGHAPGEGQGAGRHHAGVTR